MWSRDDLAMMWLFVACAALAAYMVGGIGAMWLRSGWAEAALR
jgi:hypothetical protein